MNYQNFNSMNDISKNNIYLEIMSYSNTPSVIPCDFPK